ncbi:unnamed protein product [Hymenolepis diminuta]|uniref:Uncharacterized protein n=1 Tax=Hymenolepis diminuta TaxID=6216 RepID=A0A564ZCQ2_HYMDI|nr:unnamed protein product [Hymenolepis diminuta]
MGLDTRMSCLTSTLIFIVSIAGLHLIKNLTGDLPVVFILIGIYGGFLSVLLLTAINNFENMTFGYDFYAQLFPEVIFSILLTTFAVGTVHRVCGTVCLLSSCACVYFLNVMSQQYYSSNNINPSNVVLKKKRN